MDHIHLITLFKESIDDILSRLQQINPPIESIMFKLEGLCQDTLRISNFDEAVSNRLIDAYTILRRFSDSFGNSTNTDSTFYVQTADRANCRGRPPYVITEKQLLFFIGKSFLLAVIELIDLQSYNILLICLI